jgi:hypothetical protein
VARITVEADPWNVPASDEECLALETGEVLFFPATNLVPSPQERSLLIGQEQGSALHKNISYRPVEDRVRGGDWKDNASRARVHQIMRDYSRRAIELVAAFLPRYACDWKIDFASFRPNEEQGRRIAHRSRNDLIHVDSFPSRPSHGDRLLRIFTNIHPDRPRVWVTSDNFETLARVYGPRAGFPARPTDLLPALRRGALRLLSGVGLPVVDRPEYDRFMLRFHHFMKESADFQQRCRKEVLLFPPGSSWMVFTDAASHSCVSGQFALEQTFIVRRSSLAYPERSPIAVLERLTGYALGAA